MNPKQSYENLLISLSDVSPEQAYKILKENPEHEYKSGYEFIIKKDSFFTSLYAEKVIKGRWLEAEEYIKKNPEYTYLYAAAIIEGRWIQAEPYIKKDPEYAYLYARFVIEGRFLEAEPYIKKHPHYASWYELI